MNKINASFIGDFKLGDNINFNLEILGVLYNQKITPNKSLLNKPITIIIVSIIEALLRDFIFKAQNYKSEGIPNIKKEVIENIRKKKYTKLHAYIIAAKKHDILEDKTSNIYEQLNTLRKLRNRVHIQNENNDFEKHESHAFSAQRKALAEKTLEFIMRYMSQKHARGHEYVADFNLP